MVRPPEPRAAFDPDKTFRSCTKSVNCAKSPIQDTCDPRLPPTLPILAPTLRTVTEGVGVSPALSMHQTFSRRLTRFRGSTRSLAAFSSASETMFPPTRPRVASRSSSPLLTSLSPRLRTFNLLRSARRSDSAKDRFHRPFVKMDDIPDPRRLSSIDRLRPLLKGLLFPGKRALFLGRRRWNRDGSRISFRSSVESQHRKRDRPLWGRTLRSTSISRFCHRDPTSDVASPGAVSRFWASAIEFPGQGRRFVVRNVVDRLLQHNHDAWAPPCDCVDTSRVLLEFPRTRCFESVSGLPEAASSERFRVTEIATGRESSSRGCFPVGNARAPTPRISNTPSSPLRACDALEKLVAFRDGRGPSASIVPRRTTALRPRRKTDMAIRGPRCF
jgi:hypothetical protein